MTFIVKRSRDVQELYVEHPAPMPGEEIYHGLFAPIPDDPGVLVGTAYGPGTRLKVVEAIGQVTSEYYCAHVVKRKRYRSSNEMVFVRLSEDKLVAGETVYAGQFKIRTNGDPGCWTGENSWHNALQPLGPLVESSFDPEAQRF